jgi:AAA ATPase domain
LTARARHATVGRTDPILGTEPPHGAEAGGFVGRAQEIALLEDDLLGPEPVAPVVFVHGPGGIGKSALLRELQRRAEAQGIRVARIDGRDPETAQERAPRLLEDVGETARSLVVLDSYEHVAALGALVRARVAAHVGARAGVLIAGRQPPEPAWFQDGWDARLRVVGLRPLSHDDSRTLLERRGLRDRAAIEESSGRPHASVAEVREEVRKCVLLCGNCHAEVEAGLVLLASPADNPG